MIPSVYGSCADRDAAKDVIANDVGGGVEEFGRSVEGRALRALIVPSTTPNAKTVLVTANLHGVEWIGALAALELARALGDGRGARLRSRANVVIVACVNPDGAARTEALAGNGTIKDVRGNAHGVDLNRNFPMPHGAKPFFLAASGSSDPSSATWRGPAPFSEPETRALDALAARFGFHACVSFHSFMGTLIPPKVTTSHDAATYRRLCRAWRRSQPHFFSPTFMCAPLDVFTGELEDHLHHVHRTWSLTVELFAIWRTLAAHPVAPSIFARFNPDEPKAIVDDAVAGALGYFDAALDLDKPAR